MDGGAHSTTESNTNTRVPAPTQRQLFDHATQQLRLALSTISNPEETGLIDRRADVSGRPLWVSGYCIDSLCNLMLSQAQIILVDLLGPEPGLGVFTEEDLNNTPVIRPEKRLQAANQLRRQGGGGGLYAASARGEGGQTAAHGSEPPSKCNKRQRVEAKALGVAHRFAQPPGLATGWLSDAQSDLVELVVNLLGLIRNKAAHDGENLTSVRRLRNDDGLPSWRAVHDRLRTQANKKIEAKRQENRSKADADASNTQPPHGPAAHEQLFSSKEELDMVAFHLIDGILDLARETWRPLHAKQVRVLLAVTLRAVSHLRTAAQRGAAERAEEGMTDAAEADAALEALRRDLKARRVRRIGDIDWKPAETERRHNGKAIKVGEDDDEHMAAARHTRWVRFPAEGCCGVYHFNGSEEDTASVHGALRPAPAASFNRRAHLLDFNFDDLTEGSSHDAQGGLVRKILSGELGTGSNPVLVCELSKSACRAERTCDKVHLHLGSLRLGWDNGGLFAPVLFSDVEHEFHLAEPNGNVPAGPRSLRDVARAEYSGHWIAPTKRPYPQRPVDLQQNPGKGYIVFRNEKQDRFRNVKQDSVASLYLLCSGTAQGLLVYEDTAGRIRSGPNRRKNDLDKQRANLAFVEQRSPIYADGSPCARRRLPDDTTVGTLRTLLPKPILVHWMSTLGELVDLHVEQAKVNALCLPEFTEQSALAGSLVEVAYRTSIAYLYQADQSAEAKRLQEVANNNGGAAESWVQEVGESLKYQYESQPPGEQQAVAAFIQGHLRFVVRAAARALAGAISFRLANSQSLCSLLRWPEGVTTWIVALSQLHAARQEASELLAGREPTDAQSLVPEPPDLSLDALCEKHSPEGLEPETQRAMRGARVKACTREALDVVFVVLHRLRLLFEVRHRWMHASARKDSSKETRIETSKERSIGGPLTCDHPLFPFRQLLEVASPEASGWIAKNWEQGEDGAAGCETAFRSAYEWIYHASSLVSYLLQAFVPMPRESTSWKALTEVFKLDTRAAGHVDDDDARATGHSSSTRGASPRDVWLAAGGFINKEPRKKTVQKMHQPCSPPEQLLELFRRNAARFALWLELGILRVTLRPCQTKPPPDEWARAKKALRGSGARRARAVQEDIVRNQTKRKTAPAIREQLPAQAREQLRTWARKGFIELSTQHMDKLPTAQMRFERDAQPQGRTKKLEKQLEFSLGTVPLLQECPSPVSLPGRGRSLSDSLQYAVGSMMTGSASAPPQTESGHYGVLRAADRACVTVTLRAHFTGLLVQRAFNEFVQNLEPMVRQVMRHAHQETPAIVTARQLLEEAAIAHETQPGTPGRWDNLLMLKDRLLAAQKELLHQERRSSAPVDSKQPSVESKLTSALKQFHSLLDSACNLEQAVKERRDTGQTSDDGKKGRELARKLAEEARRPAAERSVRATAAAPPRWVMRAQDYVNKHNAAKFVTPLREHSWGVPALASILVEGGLKQEFDKKFNGSSEELTTWLRCIRNAAIKWSRGFLRESDVQRVLKHIYLTLDAFHRAPQPIDSTRVRHLCDDARDHAHRLRVPDTAPLQSAIAFSRAEVLGLQFSAALAEWLEHLHTVTGTPRAHLKTEPPKDETNLGLKELKGSVVFPKRREEDKKQADRKHAVEGGRPEKQDGTKEKPNYIYIEHPREMSRAIKGCRSELRKIYEFWERFYVYPPPSAEGSDAAGHVTAESLTRVFDAMNTVAKELDDALGCAEEARWVPAKCVCTSDGPSWSVRVQ